MIDLNAAFDRHEILIKRLVRKDNAKKSSQYLTKFGMHGYVAKSEDETGILVRDMFPVDGKIVHVYLFIGSIVVGEKDKKIAELLVAVESKNALTVTKGIKISEGMHEALVNMTIEAGARLIVKCSKPLTEVWYALTIEPTAQLKSVAIPDVPELNQLELPGVTE